MEWRQRKEMVKFDEMVSDMGRMVLCNEEEQRQLERMMGNLGLDTEIVTEVGSWEVEDEWLLQWVEMQERVG